jgi:hypothetical protein
MPVAGVSQMASVSGCALLHPALQGSLGRLQLASSCLLGGGGLSNTGFLMPGVRARPPPPPVSKDLSRFFIVA